MKRKQRIPWNRDQLVVDEVLHLLGHSSRTGVNAARGPRLQLTLLEESVLMSAARVAMVAEVACVATEFCSADSAFGGIEADSANTDAADNRWCSDG